ncbi:MAG: hypothetical protein GWP08_08065 [Nitrospiraceae bacterium]|nr:hypothetical protein [Nitrospiraceae bacterium]
MACIHRSSIVKGLCRLGIEPGDVVFFHTSLRSFGAEIAGGATTVIDAVLEAVSPGGTVGVPAHGAMESGPFEPNEAPLYSSLGLLPRVFVKRPGAIRSFHPTHSVAAIGPEAMSLLKGHERCTSGVGAGSPWDKLRRRPRGKVVLFGTGIERATLFHLAEILAPAPYVGVPFREDGPRTLNARLPGGELAHVSLRDNPGCADGFAHLKPLLRECGLLIETSVAAASVSAFSAGPAVDVAVDALRRDGLFLLAGPDHCDFCRRAYRYATEKEHGDAKAD